MSTESRQIVPDCHTDDRLYNPQDLFAPGNEDVLFGQNRSNPSRLKLTKG